MRKTNLLTRSGTCAIIVATLGLSAPIFTSAAASPVIEAADSLAQKALNPFDEITPEPDIAPQKQAQVKAKKAAPIAAKTARKSGLKPMRLRLTPRFTPEQISKIETYRQTIAGGDKTAKKGLDAFSGSLNKKNRIQMTVGDNGLAVLDISKGSGGWPGYPVTNIDWEKRALSPAMKTALRSITNRCAKEAAPVYYRMDIMGGDADLGKGTYDIECVPGSERVQAKATPIKLAKAYMASEDLPLTQRQNTMQWKLPFAMFQTYVRNTPNASIAGDRAECIRIYTLMKEQYGFTENNRSRADRHLKSCATTDYSWVRKRENLPLAQ